MFESLPHLPVDPILGLVLAYNQDINPNKVDLGAGVYKNEEGRTPIMAAVQSAQLRWLKQETTKSYAPPAGFESFNQATIELLLGQGHPLIDEGRVLSVQSPGGCGALRICAGVINRCKPGAKVWVSSPTWANHIPLLGSAGLQLQEYPYYDNRLNGINFDAMMSALSQLQAGDVVLLHGCCHNPSGADLEREQWRLLAELFIAKGATPFVDIAYQGLGDGLAEDAWGLRYLAERCPEVMIATSCSKNFGLYRERVGAAVIIAENKAAADVVCSQLLNVAREIYSMPPSYGAALVDIIWHDRDLKNAWLEELSGIRERITLLRASLAESLGGVGFSDRFDYIQREKGMFSFLGISPEQVERLRKEFSIYMVDSSRINIAGLNQSNMAYVVDALRFVL